MQKGNQQDGQQGPHQTAKKEQFSQATKEKVEAAKSYIESRLLFIHLILKITGKYSRRKEEETVQRENWEQLQKIMDSLNIPAMEQEQIKKDILHKDAE